MRRILSRDDQWLLDQPVPSPSIEAVEANVFRGGSGRIQYRAAGSADLPTILFLHGLGSHSEGYRGQIAGLSKCYRTVAWNAPGYGLSTDLMADEPDAWAYVEALSAFLDALRIQRLACLVGSSWGSVIAAAFASRFPHRVGALVLSSPNIAKGNLAMIERQSALTAAKDASDRAGADREAIANRLLPRDAPATVRRTVLQLRDATSPRGLHQAISVMFSTFTPDLIARVKCPTVLVVGELDELAPVAMHAERLREAAPFSELVILKDTGHMPKLEMPARFNEIILRVIKQGGTDKTV